MRKKHNTRASAPSRPSRAKVARQMEVAKDVIKRYRNTMRELAK